jgi:hypothetical protein
MILRSVSSLQPRLCRYMDRRCNLCYSREVIHPILVGLLQPDWYVEIQACIFSYSIRSTTTDQVQPRHPASPTPLRFDRSPHFLNLHKLLTSMRLFTGLWFVSTFVAAQSDPDFFLFPPAVPLNAEFSSDSTPVSLEFAIGSTQTLKWETKLPTYQIIGRMVLSEDGAEDLTVYGMFVKDAQSLSSLLATCV